MCIFIFFHTNKQQSHNSDDTHHFSVTINKISQLSPTKLIPRINQWCTVWSAILGFALFGCSPVVSKVGTGGYMTGIENSQWPSDLYQRSVKCLHIIQQTIAKRRSISLRARVGLRACNGPQVDTNIW